MTGFDETQPLSWQETAEARRVVEILVALKSTSERERLDVLAKAIRAALDSGIVEYFPPVPVGVVGYAIGGATR